MAPHVEHSVVELVRNELRPEAAFTGLRRQGLSYFETLGILRSVYGLDLEEAKEVSIRATGAASSLDEYQRKLLDGLKLAVGQLPAAPR